MEKVLQPLNFTCAIMKPFRKTIIITALFAIVAVLAAAFIERKPDVRAFCTTCGAMETTSSWGFRSAGSKLYQTKAIAATPFSSLMETRRLVPSHQHHWLAPQDVTDPVNEYGPKVTQSIGLINTPRVIAFMSNLADYGDPDMIRHWQSMTLDPKYSYVLDPSLAYVRAPENGFSNPGDFRNWFQENSAAFQSRLAWLTTAD